MVDPKHISAGLENSCSESFVYNEELFHGEFENGIRRFRQRRSVLDQEIVAPTGDWWHHSVQNVSIHPSATTMGTADYMTDMALHTTVTLPTIPLFLPEIR